MPDKHHPRWCSLFSGQVSSPNPPPPSHPPPLPLLFLLLSLSLSLKENKCRRVNKKLKYIEMLRKQTKINKNIRHYIWTCSTILLAMCAAACKDNTPRQQHANSKTFATKRLIKTKAQVGAHLSFYAKTSVDEFLALNWKVFKTYSWPSMDKNQYSESSSFLEKLYTDFWICIYTEQLPYMQKNVINFEEKNPIKIQVETQSKCFLIVHYPSSTDPVPPISSAPPGPTRLKNNQNRT